MKFIGDQVHISLHNNDAEEMKCFIIDSIHKYNVISLGHNIEDLLQLSDI